MSNLFSSLRASATALDALQQSAASAQNNVSNAGTAGYARQRAQVSALPFDPEQSALGGVEVRGLVSSRDQFAEQAVREQASGLKSSQEKSTQLAFFEANFDLNDTIGIASRMNKLFTAFSSWTVAPLSESEKTNVISSAQNLAESFRGAAASLQASAQNAEKRITTTLSRIDDLAERVRQFNVGVRTSMTGDSGASSSVHSDLEELASFADFQAIWQKDGTVTVLLGRQVALVNGDAKFGFTTVPDSTVPLAGLEGATPKLQLRDHTGADVTRIVTGGQLGALLQFRNETVPRFAGSVTDAGDLNRLAKQMADRVNQILTDGDPNPPASIKLFQYSNLGSAALSLTVPAAMTTAVLSASDPTTAPANVNGRAVKLAALAQPGSSADKLDGLSYMSFFGNITSKVGRLAAEANAAVESRKQMHAQALGIRDDISGVSLDQEALTLMEVQRSYEATSRIIAAIDEMTRLAVNIGRN
ncbi:MAG: flagellar hook-associated protein FlgK [Bryobacteraceae bacterium]|nr:flagellar hook-associated protein FlgK [Bryobacteraceae bacterium]